MNTPNPPSRYATDLPPRFTLSFYLCLVFCLFYCHIFFYTHFLLIFFFVVSAPPTPSCFFILLFKHVLYLSFFTTYSCLFEILFPFLFLLIINVPPIFFLTPHTVYSSTDLVTVAHSFVILNRMGYV